MFFFFVMPFWFVMMCKKKSRQKILLQNMNEWFAGQNLRPRPKSRLYGESNSIKNI